MKAPQYLKFSCGTIGRTPPDTPVLGFGSFPAQSELFSIMMTIDYQFVTIEPRWFRRNEDEKPRFKLCKKNVVPLDCCLHSHRQFGKNFAINGEQFPYFHDRLLLFMEREFLWQEGLILRGFQTTADELRL